MKRQILLATSSFLVLASTAGAWNEYTNVWPSEDYYHLDAPVVVTNLFAQEYTAEFYRYTLPIPSNTPIPATTYNGEAIAAYTNSSEQRWTNQWYANIKSYVNDDVYTDTWVNAEVLTTNSEVVGITTVKTERAISSTGVPFGGKFDSLDLVGLEVALSIQERMEALGQDPSPGYGFYKDARDNCAKAKLWVYNNHDSFYATNAIDTEATTNDPENAQMVWTNFVVDASIPTNWHQYTPYHGLNGAYPGGMISNVMDQAFTISGGTSATHVVTNTVLLWNYHIGFVPTLGDPEIEADLVGTNGQLFVVVVTNISTNAFDAADDLGIEEGYNISDYTYKHLTNVLGRLYITGATFTTWNSSKMYNGIETVTNSVIATIGCDDDCDGIYPDSPDHTPTNSVTTNLVGFGLQYAYFLNDCDLRLEGPPPVVWSDCTTEERKFSSAVQPIITLTGTATCDIVSWAYAGPTGRAFYDSIYESTDSFVVSNWNHLAVITTNGSLSITGSVEYLDGVVSIGSTNEITGCEVGGERAYCDWTPSFVYK